MRTGSSLWLLFILCFTYYLMVSCNANGCSWESVTNDSGRGLSRHRATCRFYRRSTFLANERRHERAKEAARTLTREKRLTTSNSLLPESRLVAHANSSGKSVSSSDYVNGISLENLTHS